MIALAGCGRIAFDAAGDGRSADSPPPCPTCDQGLLAHWRFDEPSGTSVADDIAAHDGDLVGAVTLRPGEGVLGGAIQLQGGFVRVGWDLGPVVSSAVTIAEWVRADSTGQTSNARYFSNYYYYSADAGLLELDNDAIDGLRCVFHIGGVWRTASSTVQMTPLTWTHIACVYDGSQLMTYLDGVAVGATAGTGPLTSTAAMPLAIGASTDPAMLDENEFVGMLDDLRIYGRALDTSEVAALAGH
jgi:hypothetical protein